MSIMLKHAFYFRVEDDKSIVQVEQDPGVVNQVDLGFSGFSGISATGFEEPDYTQVEGKPRFI
jgi:hypothetical protein